jgi:hypothetical protein
MHFEGRGAGLMAGFLETLKRLHHEWSYEGRQEKKQEEEATVFGMHPAKTPEEQEAQRKAIARLTGHTITSWEKKPGGTEMVRHHPITLRPAQRRAGILEHTGVGIPRYVDTYREFFPSEISGLFDANMGLQRGLWEQEVERGGLQNWLR